MYGLAIDLGTTNIAASLIDIKNKTVVSTSSLENSQKKYGLDVITRLHFGSTENGLNILQRSVVKDINKLIDRTIKRSHKHMITSHMITKVYVVGNPIMLHFLFGLDASGFKKYPYRSNISTSASMKAIDLGIKLNKNVSIESLPIISPYLGADLVSGLIGVNYFNKMNAVFVDLGTNAEIAVIPKKYVYAASAAAGPAFKSKLIPLGSKLISETSRLLSKKHMDRSGLLLKSGDIKQADIRSLQVAKAAIHSAIEILLKKARIDKDDVKEFYISGIFGEKLNIKDAFKMKLFPVFKNAAIRLLGDAALNGAIKLILSGRSNNDILNLIKKIKEVELNREKDFQRLYLEAMQF